MSHAKPDQYIVHLVIPDLFIEQATTTEPLRLEALERLLSRAYIEPWPAPQLTASLCQLFDLPEAVTRPPVAALTHLYDVGDCREQVWLRADPVYLKPDRDRLLLFDAATALPITQAEADSFVAELNQQFAADGLQFFAPTPTRWYVAFNELPELETTPLPAALGRNVFNVMPTGAEALMWKRYLNEIQMILHQSPVNEQREQRGELPVNSVWFWGEGLLPNAPARRWVGVWSDNPVAGGLARLSDTPLVAQPDNAETMLQSLTQAGEYLIILETELTSLQDYSAWLRYVNEAWCIPLLTALHQRQLAMLVLYPCDQRVFCLTRNHARHWWRRRLPWQHFVP